MNLTEYVNIDIIQWFCFTLDQPMHSKTTLLLKYYSNQNIYI